MNRTPLSLLAALTIATGFSASCGGSTTSGGGGAMFSSSSGSSSGSGSGSGSGSSSSGSGGSSGGSSDGGSDGGGVVGDSYAPVPPQPGDASFTAIYVPNYQGSSHSIFRPIFSEPACPVVPPYGESYVVEFTLPGAGPSGSFPACSPSDPGPCYGPGLITGGGISEEFVPGGMYTLSTFDDAGIATGAMDTTEGIVPLVVKSCAQ